jgi:ATPase family associated with various cellular activities (AAA)
MGGAMSELPVLDLRISVGYLNGCEYETMVLHAVLAQLASAGQPGLPYLHTERLAVRIRPAIFLNQISARPNTVVLRPTEKTALLRTADAFANIRAEGTQWHCVIEIKIWAVSASLAEALATEFLAPAAACRIDDTVFELNWRYRASDGLSSATTMEIPEAGLLDEAYPSLPHGVSTFLEEYLDAPESVLVLQGPPGMGKTRLERELLRRMSLRKQADDAEHASALYSGDQKVWESDEIFVQFMTGNYDCLLVEDADHLIKSRAEGNETLHRFLNAADGVAQAQGRKIVFSTNLPHVHDLDDALVRPGRCFAHVSMRLLTPDEAARLVERLCGSDTAHLGRALDALGGNLTACSVADVYAAFRRTCADARSGTAAARRVRRLGTHASKYFSALR